MRYETQKMSKQERFSPHQERKWAQMHEMRLTNYTYNHKVHRIFNLGSLIFYFYRKWFMIAPWGKVAKLIVISLGEIHP